jgi:hypothetical protein
MNLMPKNAKNANSYECKLCDFICSKRSNWNIHLTTRKHNIRTTLNEIEPNHAKKCPNLFTCDCGKGYPARNSLWYHKKKCSFVQKDTEEDTKEDTSVHTGGINNPEIVEKMFAMFTQMMTQNQEFMTTVIGKVGNNTNTNCNNTNNNQFNINMFLNDHCKDAMNIKDFINSLPITTQMYDDINKKGTAEVLTNTMIEGLNKMEVVERPIHCMDKKRKVIYVKDDDNWEKDINNEKMTDTAEIILDKIRTNFQSVWTDNKQKLLKMKDDVTQNIWADIAVKVADAKLVDVPKNGIFLKRLAENTYLDKEFKEAIATGNTSFFANM